MSDNLESADEAERAEETSADGSPPPWGDDFDAQRAWNTITHLRGFESDAKRYKAIREDEDARREFLAELGYEVTADDEDEDLDDEDFDDEPVTQVPKALQKELDELKEWRSRQEQREARQQFDDHLNSLAQGAETELSAFERRAILAASIEGGFNQKATEAAFKEFLEDSRSREQKIIERYGKSKRAPHVSSGQPASKREDLDDPKKRAEYLDEVFSRTGF